MSSRLVPILLVFALAGCFIEPKPQTGAVDPAKPATPVVPVVKPAITAKQFFAELADVVAGEPVLFPDTQSVVKVAAKSMHKLGVVVPATYDTVMEKYMVNAPLTEALRKAIVADLRGFAK